MIFWMSTQFTRMVPHQQQHELNFPVGTVSYGYTSSLLCNETMSTPRQIHRPPQKISSRSFWNSIQDAEETYYGPAIATDQAKRCSDWGGMGLMENLRKSKVTIISEGSAQLDSYRANNFDIFQANRAVVQVQSNQNPKKPPAVSILLPARHPDKKMTEARIRNLQGDTLLGESTRRLKFVNELPTECDYIIRHPAFLVDNDPDHWNWWFFHLEQIKMFVLYALLQPELVETYMAPSPQMFYIAPNNIYDRPMTDGLELLFTDSRSPHDSVQIWSLGGNHIEEETRNYCFQNRLIWSPGAKSGANNVLINRAHTHMTCFSAIVTAYAAHLKASLRIPTLPTYHALLFEKNATWTPNPRVVWVGRDTTRERNPTEWQQRRIISNQEELTTYLQAKCLELSIKMDVANFYDREGSQTSYREQAHAASRANIMIGVHGAGLNLAMFMPFNSVVVEIHLRTDLQKNSQNTISQLGGGKYIGFEGKKNSKTGALDKVQVWDKLHTAISEWKKIQSK